MNKLQKFKNAFLKSYRRPSDIQHKRPAVGPIERLEDRVLLTTFFVDTISDSADDAAGVYDGQLSLREAIIASETNAAFGDAHAGDAAGDVIKFAPALNGQTITLHNGELRVGDKLRIAGGDSNITIDANFQSRVFHVCSREFVATSINIANGYSDAAGGAVYIHGDGLRKFRDVSITGSTSAGDGGGAIVLKGGDLIVDNSSLTDNKSEAEHGKGGAILVKDGRLTVIRSTLNRNKAVRSGGAIEIQGGRAWVWDSTLGGDNPGEGNQAGPGSVGIGGAINISSSSTHVRVSNTYVANNTASLEGGGIWKQAGSNLIVVEGTTIEHNIANGDAADTGGGGIYNAGGLLRVNDSTVKGNKADGVSGSGGGIFSVDGLVAIKRSLISSNTAIRAGGGIEMIDGTLLLKDTVVGGQTKAEGNVAGPELGNPGIGGGVHVQGNGQSLVIVKGGSIENNQAALEGGGVWIEGGRMIVQNGAFIASNFAHGDAADNGGGGIYSNGGTLRIYDATFRGNSADGVAGSGGAIFANRGVVELNGTTLAKNVATRAGGGLEVIDGVAIVRNSILGGDPGDGNLADGNPANPGTGGAIHVSGNAGSTIAVEHSLIANNFAALEGGGFWINASSTLNLRGGVTITGNTASGDAADTGGGGIYNDGGKLEIANSELFNNFADGVEGSGGGILSRDGIVNISDSIIAGNSANRAGGGLEIIDGTVFLNRVQIGGAKPELSNSAGIDGSGTPGIGGGLNTTGGVRLLAYDTVIDGNFASLEGGGVFVSRNSVVKMTDSRISGNEAFGDLADNGGGGVYNNGTTFLVRTTVEDNQAIGTNSTGAGIFNSGGTVRIDDVIISDNINSSVRPGAGIYTSSGGFTKVNSSRITDDLAGDGQTKFS